MTTSTEERLFLTDGAPAARFAQVLKDHIECGHGLLPEEVGQNA